MLVLGKGCASWESASLIGRVTSLYDWSQLEFKKPGTGFPKFVSERPRLQVFSAMTASVAVTHVATKGTLPSFGERNSCQPLPLENVFCNTSFSVVFFYSLSPQRPDRAHCVGCYIDCSQCV